MFQENDQERDLYERAHQAAREAEREGDAQLQAAVSPVAVYYPVTSPVRFSRWSLRFEDKRLEAVYWRVWSSGWNNSDVWSVTLELAFCFLRLCLIPTPKGPRRLLLPLVDVSVGTFSLALIIAQVLFADWYITHRGALLSFFVVLLSCWDALELLLTANTMLSAVQAILLSLAHRAPFRSHMMFRAFGICCQFAATFYGQDTDDILSRIIPELLLGHFLGTLLAYILDRRARSSFVEALPSWLLVDHRGKPAQPSPSTWNPGFYPELLEKPEEARKEQVEPALVHRALGGFAGGFGGVSGLKCANLSPVHLAASSRTHLERAQHGQSRRRWCRTRLARLLRKYVRV